MKKSKTLISALAAVIAAGAISVTAFAESAPYKFYLHCGEKGGVDWSGWCEKENNNDPAEVTTTGGYVSSMSYINISVYDVDKSKKLTKTEQITSPSDTYTLDYEGGRGIGSRNYLRGNAGYYSAEVVGRWIP